jgi:5-(carboxyamino)imidazole ribonucleotide synthase
MLGMLGGGQLGQMFTHAAHALGYKVHVFCPEAGCPASQVSDAFTQADYSDLDAVRRFAESVAVVTYEFENVPADTAAACLEHVPVRPGKQVLAIAQNRIREKNTLQSHGLPVGPYAQVTSEQQLEQAIAALGCPAVLKTAGGGYDGKGQRVLHSPEERVYAWEDLGRQPCILEAFVDFEQELSVVAARGIDGDIETFGPIANTHRHHILDVSVVPSGAPPEVERLAAQTARDVMEKLDVVGVLCVEFFQTRPTADTPAGVLINELAPRPHNSGHLTIEAYNASQFVQQVRTAVGLPPIEIQLKQPAAMANLLGDLWPSDGSDPLWQRVRDRQDTHLHLYGKSQARPGRKMGHLTCLARTPHEAIRDAVEARAMLAPRQGIAPD